MTIKSDKKDLQIANPQTKAISKILYVLQLVTDQQLSVDRLLKIEE
jgi:hypothetical protein